MKNKIQSILSLSALLCMLLSSTAYSVSIMAFGDSITQGKPYREVAGDGTRSGGYEPFLEDFFTAAGMGDAQVYNWGLAGETTEMALYGGGYQCDENVNPDCQPVASRTIDSVLSAQGSADYILILEGTNDYYNGISAMETAANLSQMAAKAQSHNMMPIIATLTPDYNATGKDILSINAAIRSTADQKGIKLVDMYEGMKDDWDQNNSDLLHPNLYGYKLMAKIWFELFYKLQLDTMEVKVMVDTQETSKATLEGNVSADGDVFGLAFEYGPDESMENSVAATPESGDGTTTFSVGAEIDSLEPNTQYYYRLVSTLNGETFYGPTKIFSTSNMVPVLTGIRFLLLKNDFVGSGEGEPLGSDNDDLVEPGTIQ